MRGLTGAHSWSEESGGSGEESLSQCQGKSVPVVVVVTVSRKGSFCSNVKENLSQCQGNSVPVVVAVSVSVSVLRKVSGSVSGSVKESLSQCQGNSVPVVVAVSV